MDIYCPRCAEPWDNDMFHEVASEHRDQGTKPDTYAGVVADFQRRGCEALDAPRCERAESGPQRLRADVSLMLMELGDMDGAMSDLEDFEYMGMFDDEPDE